MRIRCLASQKNQIQEKLGFSWTKNHALFHSDPEYEMWEDLYPDGSILTIRNIYKSAIYSCSISNSLAPVATSIHINVMDIESTSVCPQSMSFGIKWLRTTSGPPVFNDCPISYEGKAQRYCEQRDYNKSAWLTPDFSDCINQKLLRVSYEVILLMAQNGLKSSCFSWTFISDFWLGFGFTKPFSSLTNKDKTYTFMIQSFTAYDSIRNPMIYQVKLQL